MAEKECRLAYLQQILTGKKKCLKQSEVPMRNIPRWPQLSVKLMYPQIVRHYPDLLDYMPDPEDHSDRLPPRDFFFAIFAALKPDAATKMVHDAAAHRSPQENLQE